MEMKGEFLGEGAGALVYAWGDGQVAKVFKPEQGLGSAGYEAIVTAVVHASGAPCARIEAIEVVDGRPALIMRRLQGRTLLDLMLDGRATGDDVVRALAQASWDLHGPRFVAPALQTIQDYVRNCDWELERAGVPGDLRAAVQDRARAMPVCDTIVHGDLHPGNTVMTAGGPVLIDWTSAMRADPMVDVARTYLTLAVFPIADAIFGPSFDKEGFLVARPSLGQAFLEAYASLAGLPSEQLTERMGPWLPIMGLIRLREDVTAEGDVQVMTRYVRERLS